MKRKQKKLLNFESKYEYGQYTKTIYITWKVTIENIKQKECGQEAINILEMMAYFASDNVDIRLLFLKLVSEEKLLDAIELLNQYSIINVKEGVSNIYRLVQQVIRLELQWQNKEKEILKKILKQIISSNVAERNSNHVISIWEHSSKYDNLIDEFYFNFTYGYSENTLLHLFAQNDCYKIIKTILTYIENNQSNKLNAIVNATNKYGKIPLHIVVECDNLDVVKYLIEKGADFNAQDDDRWTPLHRAANSGKLG